LDAEGKLKLALDTTQNFGSLALAKEKKVIYSAYFDIKITHSETLMPAIDYAFQFCNAERRELEALYLCIGPGSFTGLRIGLATAKGIAFALGIPLYAFSSLELAALPVCGLGKNILSVIDAKMKEIYCAFYDPVLKEIIPPAVMKPEELCQLKENDFILCGSAAEMLKPLLQNAGHHFYTLSSIMQIPSAAGLFYLPEKLPEKFIPQNIENLEPMYLRAAKAQIGKKNEEGKSLVT